MKSKLLAFLLLASCCYAKPSHLRCEYLDNPLGIDARTPQLSWQSDNKEQNWQQSAYEILVASNEKNLLSGKTDVWDSGKQNSSESVGILYNGPKLESRKRYYWKVRTWDAKGKSSDSAAAWWEMGLLNKDDWKAKWITWVNPEADADWKSVRWIWVSGQDAFHVPIDTVANFHLDFNLSQKPKRAAIFTVARGHFTIKINGQEVSSKARWTQFDRQEIGDRLAVGKNTVDIKVTAVEPENVDTGTAGVKAAVGALLKITHDNGTIERISTGENWQGQIENDANWKQADVVGDLNDARLEVPAPMQQPAGLMRHTFVVNKKVRSARLYATALGSYRIFLNGNRVGQDVLTPEFTDYRKRVTYQVYDVMSSLADGKNAIAAILGDGWYGSSLTWTSLRLFQPPDRLAAQLEIKYEDGSAETVVSNETWKAVQSPIQHSEIYAGEVYDARLYQADWNKASLDDSRWASAVVASTPSTELTAQKTLPVHISESIHPKSVTPFPNNTYIFDMGQNMVGWVTLKVNGTPGTVVRLRFAEILNPDGSIYRQNLRNADATDTYILRGGGEETFEPHFTFHGFRYVEVTGYPGKPTLDSITGDVATSIYGSPTGRLTTSNELVNRMWSIGLWGQRGNFLSIPTDCPQRDERLGWMGDAGVFWRTGTYNYDIAAFSQKFMDDVVDAQTPAGAFTNVSPNVLSEAHESTGAPGWGDAGIIVPYTTWLQYGNKQIIRQHWDAMERWMKFIHDANPNFLRGNGVGPNYADWLAPDKNTDKTLLATAYWALIANMMSEMAHTVGNEDATKRYAMLVSDIRDAYQKAYIKDDGTVGTGTQTSYVVTLYAKLAPKSLEPKLVDNLVKDIESESWHLSTGFLGTPFLLFTLSNHGRADVAYRLLLNETYPSWGYMLSKGATTWWERWNGDTGDPAMNSYNHYAFGSVVAWVYRQVAGIDIATENPAFHELVIHPRLDVSIDHAHGEYDSVYGTITTDWSGKQSGPFSLKVSIPANTTAKVFLPVIANTQVTQNGRKVSPQQESGVPMVQIGSGTYEFQLK
ncbi:MAG TPA: family 78 glycoside hydrolase catalytic domain [Terriglobales bacterium]|nr:family 78 glycoside hydrolase catalytic domain [Terriglobales bacterium]